MADVKLRRHVPVLTYHSIDDSAAPVSVSEGEFRRQMQGLANAGWRTLTIEAFLRGRREGGWPERTFLLTFDDGYRNLLDLAVPIARECAFTGVVFVASDRVGGSMTGPHEPSWTPACPLLDWNGLRRVAEAGWTIGSHARTHRRLTALRPAEVVHELETSKTAIEQEIGARVVALAYPYGAVSADVERAAEVRYEAAFGTTLARVSVDSRPTNLERIDAYYLQGMPMAQLDSAAGQLYLAMRRAGRAMRPRSL